MMLDQEDTAALALLGALFADGGPAPACRWIHAGDLTRHERPLRWADSRQWITRRVHAASGQWRLSLTQLGLRELSVFLRNLNA